LRANLSSSGFGRRSAWPTDCSERQNARHRNTALDRSEVPGSLAAPINSPACPSGESRARSQWRGLERPDDRLRVKTKFVRLIKVICPVQSHLAYRDRYGGGLRWTRRCRVRKEQLQDDVKSRGGVRDERRCYGPKSRMDALRRRCQVRLRWRDCKILPVSCPTCQIVFARSLMAATAGLLCMGLFSIFWYESRGVRHPRFRGAFAGDDAVGCRLFPRSLRGATAMKQSSVLAAA